MRLHMGAMARHAAPLNTPPYGEGMDLADARTQWIDAGLRGLRREGVEAVRVERLATLMTITLAADGRLERAMRDWARNDADVAGALAEIDGKRLRHVADLLVATG